MPSSTLDQLNISHHFVEQLPADSETGSEPRPVFEACYSLQAPKPFPGASLISASPEAAALIGLSVEDFQHNDFTQVFAGQKMLNGMQPYACCYGGHQFGNWAGQLGDGRAINLGEVQTADGHWSLQLKGAGPTPYSRRADGLAVLRSSIREYLCSEAMFHLNVPTTRALSLVNSGEQVPRDMFYNGNAKLEPGAIVCRMAPSFIRFGSFEIFASRKDYTRLEQLMDYTIEYEFPEFLETWRTDKTAAYIAWFDRVCDSTIDMIVAWMRVGFVHGVMNTDNMSIHGLTIDYGPYGWIDNYDPSWTPNTTDNENRRYRFSNQAGIAQWNLLQLANAIYPLIKDAKPLEEILDRFQDTYMQRHKQMLYNKLGLVDIEQEEQDNDLLNGLNNVLQNSQLDMTLFYRQLADFDPQQPPSDSDLGDWLEQLSYQQQIDNKPLDPEQLQAGIEWLGQYFQRLLTQTEQCDQAQRQSVMRANNPYIILRNYLSQQAIEKAEAGDYSEIELLLAAVKNPYEEKPEYAHLAQKRPDWALNKAGCSSLSCSS